MKITENKFILNLYKKKYLYSIFKKTKFKIILICNKIKLKMFL